MKTIFFAAALTLAAAQSAWAGDLEAGCTVHLVTEGVDEGPVLGQARVPILPGDDAHAIAERVLAEEHRLYPAMLARLCQKLAGRA